MNQQPIDQPQRLAGLQGQIAAPSGLSQKIVESKWVGRNQTIVPRMPSRGMAQVSGMIHQHQADLFAINRAEVIDPSRTLAPNRLVTLSLAVDCLAKHLRNIVFRIGCQLQIGVSPDGESTLLRVAESNWLCSRLNRQVPIQPTFPLIESKPQHTAVGCQLLAAI